MLFTSHKENAMADQKLKSLNDIFNDTLFRIPDFQRGYSWEDKQLEDFWDDLIQLKSEKTHYTGLLTVEEIDKKRVKSLDKWKDDLWLIEQPDFKAYYLIDGQQRLTTSMILINEILSLLDDNDEINRRDKLFWQSKFLYYSHNGYKSYIFGYEKDDPSYEFYKTKILGQPSSTSDKVPEKTLYTLNLDNASKFFKEKLTTLDKDKIKDLFTKLVFFFKFNFYEIDNELDIYVTFETMNNRGKSLSNLELLKNRLIYLTSTIDNSQNIDGLRRDINEAWKTIYEYLGKNTSNKLDDDAFLFDHWVMYFGKYNRNESASYARYLLNEYFTVKSFMSFNSVDSKDLRYEIIQNYVYSLQNSIKYWFNIQNPSFANYTDDVKEWLYKINRIKIRHFSPLLMAVASKSKDGELSLSLLKEVERFIFLVFLVSQKYSNTGNSKIYNFAYEFYIGTISLEQLIGNIRYLTDGGYEIDDEYIYEGYADINSFVNSINKNPNGYYGWSGLTYFLYEYENHLKFIAKGTDKVTWSKIEKRSRDETIEHIYPKSADSDYWKKNIGKFLRKQKDKDRVLHSLGNLLLLSRSKNSELQNDDFPNKLENKNGRGFKNGSYSEIEVSKNKNWTIKEIKERGEKMLEFMDKRWEIDFESWEIKIDQLLGLDSIKYK